MKSPTVVVLLGMKGGTGKSTVAIHLAVAAHQAGPRVTLLDTDPQATTMAWARTAKQASRTSCPPVLMRLANA